MTQTRASSITLRTVPALAGWHWIKRGWQLLRANPIHIHMAAFFFLGSLGVLSVVPIIGGIVAALLMPALYLGVMATIAQSENTHSSQPSALLDALGSPFKRDASGERSALKRLAVLGLVYALSVFAMVGLYSLFDGGSAFKTFILGDPLPADPKDRAELMSGFVGLILIYAPLSMAFWFTQQLVGWHGQSIVKAVFFSWLGCWRNKAAFAVYAVAWVCIFLATSLAIVGVSSLLGSPALAGLLLTPLSLFLMVWVMCSFYASYESLVEVVEAVE
jgi:hypothetical protein